MGPSMSVCLSRLFCEEGNPHDQGHCCATIGADVIVGTHCRSTLISDDISVAITYVMYREEHLWNVSVLKRVHLSSLIIVILMQ
jgi:hypothetical protein